MSDLIAPFSRISSPYQRWVETRRRQGESVLRPHMSPTIQLSLNAFIGAWIKDVDCIVADPKIEPCADGGFQLFLK